MAHGPAKGYKHKTRRGPITKHPGTAEVPLQIKGNAQRGAFLKGMVAGAKGHSFTRTNPYSAESATYERGLWRRWREGYDHAARLIGLPGLLDPAERWEANIRP